MNNDLDGRYQYYAFISYKREDERWAKWFQHKLEHYRLPSNLNGKGNLPKEILHVFKDTSELTPGNLPEQINETLEQSKYLIVICLPRSAQSEWQSSNKTKHCQNRPREKRTNYKTNKEKCRNFAAIKFRRFAPMSFLHRET